MQKTNIEWADYVWNPVTGCSKVSQGCKNCYAETIHHRFEKIRGKFTDVVCHPDRLEQPLKVRKPGRVFVNSMSDLFHENVSFEFIAKVFIAMALCPHHTFLILTKRPERAIEYFKEFEYYGFGDDRTTDELATDFHPYLYDKKTHELRDDLKKAGWSWDNYFGDDSRFIFENDAPVRNVWIGVSVEDQATADERIPLLLQIPAAVRFLSCEPLLGPIDLNLKAIPTNSDYVCPQCGPDKYGDDIHRKVYHTFEFLGNLPAAIRDENEIHWVICGGESGHKARPMHPDWARSLRDQCASANVPFFFKQWGEWCPVEIGQAPMLEFANGESVDSHWVNVIDPVDPLGKPGRYKGHPFMDVTEAAMYCIESKSEPCAFWKCGKSKSGHLLDGVEHRAFPTQHSQLNTHN